MSSRGVVVIVPMKPLRLVKSRLAERLESHQREAVGLGMFDRVVRAAVDSSATAVWVVGGDEAVKRAALRIGAQWWEDDGKDLNDSLMVTFERAFRAGLAPAYLPADLPFVSSEDVSNLLEASSGGETVTLSPAHRDGGTNAIVVPAYSAFRPMLGLDSFDRHRQQAREGGLALEIFDSTGIGLDLDTPEDLAAYEMIEPDLIDRLTSR
ncbi:MAG: 2-phospho-L-lactate guanylyltransferase [Chloroflexi bacterium]|nr:2-phospho-L-lactate guanylyltransferase [Chloroflexota bacterium]